MDPTMIIMLVLLLGGLLLMNTFAKRSQAKRTAEREATVNALKPGAWVQTFSGFFGRMVDIDGDVIILETPSGEETYWLKGAVKGAIEPPFEIQESEREDSEEITASDLDELEAKFQDHIDSAKESELVELTEEEFDGDEVVETDVAEVADEPSDKADK